MLLHSWVCRESDVYSLGNMLACLAKLRCFPYPREYTWRDIAALAMQPDGGLPEVCCTYCPAVEARFAFLLRKHLLYTLQASIRIFGIVLTLANVSGSAW